MAVVCSYRMLLLNVFKLWTAPCPSLINQTPLKNSSRIGHQNGSGMATLSASVNTPSVVMLRAVTNASFALTSCSDMGNIESLHGTR